ncbi:nuclear transport factor 2 family protein [Massilia sp. PWRC2]|uniref:nuclear transport factor 2 family protein n=1 Tax=Massilia sp. PWRC2 TaxID=2804626 RepID=UPI003CF72257
MTAAPNEAALERLIGFYESISEAALAQLACIYAADAAFKDPFNEVRGIAPITAIFRHMYQQVNDPRFVIRTRVLQGDDAFISWEFGFTMKRFSTAPQTIRGATHVRFDGQGRVCLHRDYWDAAEELYEKLPLLGGLMRALKRRAAS